MFFQDQKYVIMKRILELNVSYFSFDFYILLFLLKINFFFFLQSRGKDIKFLVSQDFDFYF